MCGESIGKGIEMISGFSRGSAAVLLCAFGAGAAQADVSAQDVWSDWRAYMEGTGYVVSGTEQMSGNTLTVSNTLMSAEMEEDNVAFELRMGDLSFTENADGTVSIAFPPEMPFVVSGITEDGEPFEATITYSHTGFSMVAGGDPDDMTYNYTASSVDLNLTDVVVDGAPIGRDIAAFNLSILNLIGSTEVTGGDVRSYAQKLQASEISYDVAINDPETDGQLLLNASSEGLSLDSVTDLPGALDPENMAAMIEAGFSANGVISLGAGNSSFSFKDEVDTFSYEGSSDGGSMGFQLGAEGLGYEIEQNNVAMNVAGSGIPLPVSVNFNTLVFDLLIPIMQSDDPQAFGLTIGLSDFTMSDLIWGIFDPTGQLPRDPATILLAVSGQMKVLANILDPMVAAQMEDGPPPGELQELTIEGLEVSVAGASLTGTGDFSFDNTDTVTFDGIPRPIGGLELQLVGGNGLLDKLVAMGLLPQEQAGGARMMMGLFAVPGDAPDTLNSRLEINEQGHILANGQRIQ